MIKVPRLPIRSWIRQIHIETTPNENSLKFIPGRTILNTGTIEFSTPSDTKSSPLASKLFQINGVKSVFYGPDFITVTKDQGTEWVEVKSKVSELIETTFKSGEAIITNQQPEECISEDSETISMIKELLDTRIRPVVQDDGGDIHFVAFENGIVKLKLRGACKTCSSSVITLKNGIEGMMKHYIPEVQSVEEVEDELDAIAKKQLEELEQKLNK